MALGHSFGEYVLDKGNGASQNRARQAGNREARLLCALLRFRSRRRWRVKQRPQQVIGPP